MRSTTETLLYAVGMDGLGSVSVTAMYSSTRCVSVAKSKASWYPQRKSIIKFLCPRAALTQEII